MSNNKKAFNSSLTFAVVRHNTLRKLYPKIFGIGGFSPEYSEAKAIASEFYKNSIKKSPKSGQWFCNSLGYQAFTLFI